MTVIVMRRIDGGHWRWRIDDADDHDDDDNEYDEVLSILLKRKCQSEKAKAQFSSALWPVFGDVLGDEPKYTGAVYFSECRRLEVPQEQFVKAVAVIWPPRWLFEILAPQAVHRPMEPVVGFVFYQSIFRGHQVSLRFEPPPPTAPVAIIPHAVTKPVYPMCQ